MSFNKSVDAVSRFFLPCPACFNLSFYSVCLYLILSFTFFNASVAEISSEPALEQVTLQLKWQHQFQFAGYYAAKEKGFYAAEGLKVKILEYSKKHSNLYPSGDNGIDYAVADSSIVVEYSKGSKISILAAIFQHDPLVFISKKSSGISSPYDLAGKRIMFNSRSGNEASLRALLYLNNIDDSQYTFVKHTFNNNDLVNNKVDVMSAYLTDQIFFFKKHGIELNIINPQNYGIDFYSDLLITSQHEITSHPGRAERFRRATLKGWQYALEHTEELIDIIKSKYHSKLSTEHLRFEAKETIKMIRPGHIPIGHINVNRLFRVAEIYTQLKMAKPLSEEQLNNLVYGTNTLLNLTAEEKTWLDQHPVIKVGIDPSFAPFEWLDENGQMKGMNKDYLDIVQKILDVQFEIVKTGSWQETLELARNNQVDMLSDANQTPEREQYLLFGKPYIETPVVIISDIGKGFIGKISRLKGKKIALEKSYFLNDLIRSKYPDIEIITAKNGSDALRLLDLGLVDAYIGDAIYANYLIQKNNLLNLRISGRTEYNNYHRFAVPKEKAVLLPILQKAYRHLSHEQKEQLLYKWRGMHVAQGVPLEQLLYIGAAVVLLFLIFTYWLFRLKKEIRQRNKIEQALIESEARFRTIFEATDAVAVQGYNKNREVIYWNPASEAIYGYSAKEAIGKKLEDLIIPDEMRATVIQSTKDWIRGSKPIPSSELTLKKKGGGEVHVFSSHVLLTNTRNEPELYCIDIDISLHIEQAKLIEHQAYFDALTDLPNRFLALDRLSQLLNKAERNQERVAVLFLDLDDFKKINDTLGHESGDKLLIEAADRLHSIIRTDDTVGRLGGDEFIVLAGSIKQISDIQSIAENLLNQFRSPFKIGSRELILTASIGIALYPDDGKDSSELLRNADSAMYHAKRTGRNTYSYFTPKMNQEASRRLELDEQMHGALLRNEFEIYYQPKIDIYSGKLIGAEALLRWHNPVLGDISPVEFIPVCEQTGLIIPIGQYVLKQAIKQTLQWQQDFNEKFSIAINLSPRQFRDPELVNSIFLVLKDSGLAPTTLELEITEGVLMSGHNYIKEALSRLSEKGISIAMDDFGTGYSSLSYLRSYPFNVLKIDRSFIKDITADSADRELVNAAIAMAHGLNLKVVAEGVETYKQLKYLQALDCDIAQGYYYSKPVSAKDFTQLLQEESFTS